MTTRRETAIWVVVAVLFGIIFLGIDLYAENVEKARKNIASLISGLAPEKL